MQTTFPVVILPLETQRLFQALAVAVPQFGEFAVAVVARGPDDFALLAGQFLRRAEVVVVVVERRGVLWAFAFEQGQWAEGAGFVDVALVVAVAAFGDDLIALPDKFRGLAGHGLFDASAEGIVAVGRFVAVRAGDADEAVLAVVAVVRDEALGFAAAFADEVAVGVVVVVAVALHEQAVGLEGGRAGAVLQQQVAGRVVGEAFGALAVGIVDAEQAILRVVLVAAAVSIVGKRGEVAVGAVGIIAP